MQQALYHPEHGYYSSGRAAIGRAGDYFTSVSVGPVFGRLLAAQFAEIWERLGKIDNFIVVEQGAHDGQFARDVLEYAKQNAPEFFAALSYQIVEPFPIWQDRQRETLEGRAPSRPGTTQRSSLQDLGQKMEWRESLEPFTGIHFSNELLDAMPIDLPGKLVDLDGDIFVFVDGPAGGDRKFNQSALDWVDNVAGNLQHGYVIAVDYGRVADDFEPTAQFRAQHRHLNSPFDQIGEADITAHVDWKSIAARARENGLRIAGFADQHHFLTGILSAWPHVLQTRSLDSTGLTSRVSESDGDAKAKRELQTLLHPEMMGRSFQILALEKNLADFNAPLAGFKFARDARCLD